MQPVDPDGRYRIHFGAKRFRAAGLAGLERVPVTVTVTTIFGRSTSSSVINSSRVQALLIEAIVQPARALIEVKRPLRPAAYDRRIPNASSESSGLKLTAFADYSLRTLMCLAAGPGRRAAIAEIVGACGISEHHLTKVAHGLGRQGRLVNVRGHGGGLGEAPQAFYAALDRYTVADLQPLPRLLAIAQRLPMHTHGITSPAPCP